MQMEKITIREADVSQLKSLGDFVEALGYHKDEDYFLRQFEKQKEGERILLIGECEGRMVSYCILNWQPKYAFFQKLGFPEIQDLNVLHEFRQRGVATQMIEHCEALARAKRCEYMGIGVGLHASYGPAQRLYVKLGYVPDGNGLNYDRQQVAFGSFYPVDDELCLMMIKALSTAV
jgi:GNAT superfamily N-acetyltransferase